MSKSTIKFYQAPTMRIFLGGVPFNVFVGELCATMCAVLVYYNFWLIPIITIVHVALVSMYRKDEYFLEIIKEHIFEPEYFDV